MRTAREYQYIVVWTDNALHSSKNILPTIETTGLRIMNRSTQMEQKETWIVLQRYISMESRTTESRGPAP